MEIKNRIIISVLVVGLGVLLTAFTSDVTKVSEPGINLLDGSPYLEASFGSWTGSPLEGLSEDEKKILPADTTGSRRIYTDIDGNKIFCSIVLAGKDITSIHRPELCLPGQGWTIHDEHVESIKIDVGQDDKLDVMRMNTYRNATLPNGQKIRVRSIFAYWFVGKDRITPHHWERILWTSKDRILHNTNHRWAYILIHAPITEDFETSGQGKSESETMALVADFVRDLYPTLVLN